ncbi:MAG: hypothetical protein SFV19_13045 [Rhodospirillaceae bacterium]|nr:hypothetical protein [Rhodospirillaceae bacterium]
MNSRSISALKDRYRVDWVLHNPPRIADADITAILATCPRPLHQMHPGASAVSVSQEVSRREEVAKQIAAALGEFIVERALESEPPLVNLQNRLKVICDAADRFERALGVVSAQNSTQLPWPITKRILHAITATTRAQSQAAVDCAQGQQTPETYSKELQRYTLQLDSALAGMTALIQWIRSATRMEASRQRRRKRQRDEAFDRLLLSLTKVWTGPLDQELQIPTRHRRNVGRWSPLPESFRCLIDFVQNCMKAIGIQPSQDDLMAAFHRLSKASIAKATLTGIARA